MPLPTGTKLGPYELAESLGAGGMGEVYRARDPRLGRDVAVKIIPASLAGDATRLHRFEQEARAAAALNHPNILAVYDFGKQDRSPYIVSEILEGETLRQRLRGGALPVRKAIDYAHQIARGLAAAHDKGILHRDLKPENIFLTRDGRVKILDFGLAKLIDRRDSGADVTRTIESEVGTVLGTVGYMSPEQVRGRPADARSDLFSFGVVLYEMFSGQRAFRGETPADTMTAILTQEPPELANTSRNVTPALERIVRHCLEKNPEERFQSASDLAFDLETISAVSSANVPSAQVAAPRRWVLAAAVAGVVLLATVVTALLARRSAPSPLSYQQLTFQRGVIHSARFAPDGQSVIYGADWQGNATELFSTFGSASASRPLGVKDTDLLAISRSGEMAVSVDRNMFCSPCRGTLAGTLARVSLGGGSPREVLEGVKEADWGPDGNFAVVRNAGGRSRLEYPPGHVLYETSGAISDIRFSHNGKLIAFMDHPDSGDSAGTVAFVDLAGRKKTISQSSSDERGLAWSHDDREVWYTAAPSGEGAARLYATSLEGRTRVVLRVPGQLTLHDIAGDGRLLLAQGSNRAGMLAFAAHQNTQRDLSWLDYSFPVDLSADGKLVLFTEQGEGAGRGYMVYMRKTDGSAAVRLGEGNAVALSPDGKWALAVTNSFSSHPEPVLLPLRSGEIVKLRTGDLSFSDAAFLPDGKRLLVLAAAPGHAPRLYLQDIAGEAARPISGEGVGADSAGLKCLSPDGRFVVALGPDGRHTMYPIDGGEPRPISGLSNRDRPVRFNADGRHLFVFSRDEHGAQKLERFEVATGRRTPWPFPAADMAGIVLSGLRKSRPTATLHCITTTVYWTICMWSAGCSRPSPNGLRSSAPGRIDSLSHAADSGRITGNPGVVLSETEQICRKGLVVLSISLPGARIAAIFRFSVVCGINRAGLNELASKVRSVIA